MYRISTRYIAKLDVKMMITEMDPSAGRKVADEKKAYTFTKKMRFNDETDRMRKVLVLSGRYYCSWPKYLVAKTIEDAVINAYVSYLLEQNCPIEPFTKFVYFLGQKCIDRGSDLRKPLVHKLSYQRSFHNSLKRSRLESDAALIIGESCRGYKHIGSIKYFQKPNSTKRYFSAVGKRLSSCAAHAKSSVQVSTYD